MCNNFFFFFFNKNKVGKSLVKLLCTAISSLCEEHLFVTDCFCCLIFYLRLFTPNFNLIPVPEQNVCCVFFLFDFFLNVCDNNEDILHRLPQSVSECPVGFHLPQCSKISVFHDQRPV